jgi:hypothetical protein
MIHSDDGLASAGRVARVGQALKKDRAAWMALRAGAALAVVTVALSVAVPESHASPSATAAPTLGGWNISADGNAVDVLVDNTTGLAGIHPLSEADFPAAQSQFATGPFGTGLASVFWPGSAGGNFGSLSTELGFPSQLAPLMSQTNDPVKASASYPSGPASASYPPGSPGGAAEMVATAQAGGTTAEGTITDESPSAAVLSFSQAKGVSSALAAKTADASAQSDVSDVKLLGGLIDIGSIASSATATSDGTTGTGSSTTHVGAITVLGQPASIGSDGLVLPKFANSLGPLTGPVVQNAISQVISGMGLTITEFPGTETAKGAGYTATSGGVSIGIDPPSSAAPILEQAGSLLAPFFPAQAAIVPTLPGLLQGFTLTITLGRANASANAAPAFSNNFNFTPPPLPSSGSNLPSSSLPTTPAVSATVPVQSSPVPSNSGATSSGSQSPAVAPITPAPAAALVSLSKPLSAGAVATGVLATLVLGYGLMRLARMLLPRDVDPVCPLGKD